MLFRGTLVLHIPSIVPEMESINVIHQEIVFGGSTTTINDSNSGAILNVPFEIQIKFL